MKIKIYNSLILFLSLIMILIILSLFSTSKNEIYLLISIILILPVLLFLIQSSIKEVRSNNRN